MCVDATFSFMQAAAFLVATISMVLLLAALFRPATGKCCSSNALGTASGTLMVMYASAQTLAVVAVVTTKVTEKDFGGESSAWHACV